jgi:hypothetical protein
MFRPIGGFGVDRNGVTPDRTISIGLNGQMLFVVSVIALRIGCGAKLRQRWPGTDGPVGYVWMSLGAKSLLESFSSRLERFARHDLGKSI